MHTHDFTNEEDRYFNVAGIHTADWEDGSAALAVAATGVFTTGSDKV